MALPHPPAEPPIVTSLDGCAPQFVVRVNGVLDRLRGLGYQPKIAESMRTDEREAFLFGFGRTWDDGRGIVTNAKDASLSWHGYGLAVDIIDERYGWEDSAENDAFFTALMIALEDQGLTSGADWDHHPETPERFTDRPHGQWWIAAQHVLSTEGKPSEHAQLLRSQGNLAQVWAELHAA